MGKQGDKTIPAMDEWRGCRTRGVGAALLKWDLLGFSS